MDSIKDSSNFSLQKTSSGICHYFVTYEVYGQTKTQHGAQADDYGRYENDLTWHYKRDCMEKFLEIFNINMSSITKSEAECLYIESGWKWIINLTQNKSPYWKKYQPTFDEIWTTLETLRDYYSGDEEDEML